MKIADRYPAWFLVDMEEEVRELECSSGCGKDCVEVLDAAMALVKLMPDVTFGELRYVASAAIGQCNVFYFG